MVVIVPSSWRLEFARKAAMAHDLEKRLRDEKLVKEKREKEERDTSADEQADMLAIVELVLATTDQIDAFTVKLDAYDAATIEALMLNEEELVAVRERIASMLLDAHVLPDGRRVFKTRDGTQVFDQYGSEIAPDELAPEEIADDKPRWEDWLHDQTEEMRLVEERQDLLAFQEKLDDTRERLEDPALTAEDLSALEDELGEAAPDRVKELLGHPEPAPKQERVQDAGAVPEETLDRRIAVASPVPATP